MKTQILQGNHWHLEFFATNKENQTINKTQL